VEETGIPGKTTDLSQVADKLSKKRKTVKCYGLISLLTKSGPQEDIYN
jgi:hypothetical protein